MSDPEEDPEVRQRLAEVGRAIALAMAPERVCRRCGRLRTYTDLAMLGDLFSGRPLCHGVDDPSPTCYVSEVDEHGRPPRHLVGIEHFLDGVWAPEPPLQQVLPADLRFGFDDTDAA